MAASDSALQDFRAGLRGPVILPGEPSYDESRKVFNGMVDRRPAMIVKCVGVSDVIAAVRFARGNNLPASVRSTGHNVVGMSVCDGGVVLDLSLMKGIHVDAEQRTARVEAGVTWAELNHELQVFGLAATGGYVGTTGVAGLTLGGGLGWMVRKHGLALDNLLSADVVTADGQLLRADENTNADLFWAIRGGGGNFGVVTSFQFQAHLAGTVLAGMVMHPLSRARDALRFWREYESDAPEEMSNGALLFTPPSEMPLPEPLRTGILGIGGVWVGPLETGERAVQPLREYGPPLVDLYQRVPYSAAQGMADFLWTRGDYNYWKSNFLKALTDEAIDTILAFHAKAPSPRTVIVLEHDGDGAFDRIAEDATAFGDRRWPYNIVVTAAWREAADSEANIRWTRDFWDAMRPHLADARYVNYLGDATDEGVRAAYGPKYEHLAAIKAKYDPDNFFCMNQNIRPVRTASRGGEVG